MLTLQAVGEGDPELAGEMVIAGARPAQCRTARRFAEAGGRPVRSDRQHRLDDLGHPRAGQSVKAPAPLLLDSHEAPVEQL